MALMPLPEEVLTCLTSLLQVSESDLQAARVLAATGRYQTWRIPKGDGSTRRIDAPPTPLRTVQRAILEQALYRSAVSPQAHGFVPGRSIVTNARVHLPTARALLSVDIENAYPSVSHARVRQALEWGLGRFLKCLFPALSGEGRGQVFDALAELCCHRGCLPQGAPTSGALLNLVCGPLDRQCTRLVRNWEQRLPDLRYSRYADDLTFTARVAITDAFTKRVLERLRRNGFRANLRKRERYTARAADLVICGVRLHEGQLTLPRKVLRRYRALFFQALAYDPRTVPYAVRQHLRGALGFLTMVCPACPASLQDALQRVLQQHHSWLQPTRCPRPGLSLLAYEP